MVRPLERQSLSPGFDSWPGVSRLAMGHNLWHHFGIGAPLILEPILVGIGIFTGVRGFDPWPPQFLFLG